MSTETETAAKPARIKFHYIKNPAFRVVHVDGGIGGPTPRGSIHLALYSERAAIPQIVEHSLSEAGTLGEELGHEGKEGIVREIDIDLIMTIQTAAEIRDWLDKTIGKMRQVEEASKLEAKG